MSNAGVDTDSSLDERGCASNMIMIDDGLLNNPNTGRSSTIQKKISGINS